MIPLSTHYNNLRFKQTHPKCKRGHLDEIPICLNGNNITQYNGVAAARNGRLEKRTLLCECNYILNIQTSSNASGNYGAIW